MLELQFKALSSILPFKPVISIDDLQDRFPRTLLFGYTYDRQSHHVYIKDYAIHVAVYGGIDNTKPKFVDVSRDQDYAPNKRVYPARSDFEFCALLIRRGIEIIFTDFVEEEKNRLVDGNYYGKLVS